MLIVRHCKEKIVVLKRAFAQILCLIRLKTNKINPWDENHSRFLQEINMTMVRSNIHKAS